MTGLAWYAENPFKIRRPRGPKEKKELTVPWWWIRAHRWHLCSLDPWGHRRRRWAYWGVQHGNDLHAEWPCGLLLPKNTRLGEAPPTEGKSETIRRGSKPQHWETCTNTGNVMNFGEKVVLRFRSNQRPQPTFLRDWYFRNEPPCCKRRLTEPRLGVFRNAVR